MTGKSKRGGKVGEKDEKRHRGEDRRRTVSGMCEDDVVGCIELQLYCAVRCLWSLRRKTQ